MNTIKFYIKNRFNYVLMFWCICLGYCVVSNNPYMNVFILFIAFCIVMMALSFLCEMKMNASERLFMKKIMGIFA